MIIRLGIKKKSQLAKNTALFAQMILSDFDTSIVDSCIIAHLHLPLNTRDGNSCSCSSLEHFTNSVLHTPLLVDVISIVCNQSP